MADTVLLQGGRPNVQSAIPVISDIKYSCKYPTAIKARGLQDENMQVCMTPATDFKGKKLEALKEWASKPWEMDYEHIPGPAALTRNRRSSCRRSLQDSDRTHP